MTLSERNRGSNQKAELSGYIVSDEFSMAGYAFMVWSSIGAKAAAATPMTA